MGWVTPPPTLNTPPPVPPPLPGPSPPPLPEPTPVPFPVPIPPPLPGPFEGGAGTAVGFPHMLSAILTFRSGGPSSVESNDSCGFGILIFVTGGATCLQVNFGAAPFDGGLGVRSPPPPPPPACLSPGGSCNAYGESWMGITSACCTGWL